MVRFTVLDGTEGQFVSLMRKNSAGFSKNMTYKKPVRNKIIEEFIKENLCLDEYYIYEQNGYYYMSLKPLWDLGKNVLRYGIYIGEIKKNIFYPSHNLFRSNALRNCFKKVIELNDEEYLKYRSGLNLYHEDANGYYLLTYHGYAFAHDLGKWVDATHDASFHAFSYYQFGAWWCLSVVCAWLKAYVYGSLVQQMLVFRLHRCKGVHLGVAFAAAHVVAFANDAVATHNHCSYHGVGTCVVQAVFCQLQASRHVLLVYCHSV